MGKDRLAGAVKDEAAAGSVSGDLLDRSVAFLPLLLQLFEGYVSAARDL